jgi:2-polyprenyl-3-methyl-5-hydroxy-6-metoxy-1,4-benzoquinol methylase
MKTKEDWNELFAGRDEPLPPEDYLLRNMDLLRGPSVLDLACGDGRNALFLEERGFMVTAVDYAEEGLAAINRSQKGNVVTLRRDLSVPGALDGLGRFDSILINHYLPEPHTLSAIPDHLDIGGILMMITFDHKMTEEGLRPHSFALDFETLAEEMPQMESLRQDRFHDDRGTFKAAVMRRKA